VCNFKTNENQAAGKVRIRWLVTDLFYYLFQTKNNIIHVVVVVNQEKMKSAMCTVICANCKLHFQ